VAEGDDLVEGEDEVEGGAADAFFVRLLLRVLRDDFTEQRRMSRSSRMLDCLLVTRRRYSAPCSIGV